MGKMTLDDLRRLRAEEKEKMDLRDPENKNIQVIVGMGTSGIAAGAKETLGAFVSALEERGMVNVSVRQTGSLGLDFAEPTVEVVAPNMPPVIYGRVDAETAKRIVEQHIIGKTMLQDHIYDRPAADIVNGSADSAEGK